MKDELNHLTNKRVNEMKDRRKHVNNVFKNRERTGQLLNMAMKKKTTRLGTCLEASFLTFEAPAQDRSNTPNIPVKVHWMV